MLAELIRSLLEVRNERDARLGSLLASLKGTAKSAPLSAEDIITLVQQHLACKGASRLPVLVVAAAYSVAAKSLGERILPLQAHNAADEQTGALGDVQITLVGDDSVVTSYEMKDKLVTAGDIDRAIQKIAQWGASVDHYVFITTEPIDEKVQKYARDVYDATRTTEMVILDCVGFLRHFLHLFHRLRGQYLEEYQDLVLTEPTSAVSHVLKEAFLTLRHAAEADRA